MRCWTELTARGLDANSLVRYGLCDELLAGILSPYVLSKIDIQPEEVSGPNTLVESRAAAWRDLLDAHLADHGGQFMFDQASGFPRIRREVVAEGARLLLTWVQNASLADLIGMRAPSKEWLTAQSPLVLEADIVEQYRWAAERFSVTRLQEWSLPSLHLEWRWLRGEVFAPCPQEVMLDRTVTAAELDREIAARAVDALESPAPTTSRVPLTARMQRQAQTLLRDGKHDAAATLFEFAVAENDRDADAHNNLGFCLMPRDPDRAWQHLKESIRLGYEPYVINLYNRVLCLALLGDIPAALELAEDEWDAAAAADHGKAVLWVLDDPSTNALSMAEGIDPVIQLAELSLSLARTSSSAGAVERWSARVAA